jgi:hypothetical protein
LTWLYVVDEHTNQIRRKTAMAANEQHLGVDRNPHKFATQQEARAFVLERAKQQLAATRRKIVVHNLPWPVESANVKRLERKLADLERKWGK